MSERGIAGELLARTDEGPRGTRIERKAVRFAGFEVRLGDVFIGETPIAIKGEATRMALGTMRAVERVVKTLEESLTQPTDALDHARQRLVDLNTQVGVPFERADKLAGLLQLQQDLVAALDLTKAQAVSLMESEEPSEPATTNEPATLAE